MCKSTTAVACILLVWAGCEKRGRNTDDSGQSGINWWSTTGASDSKREQHREGSRERSGWFGQYKCLFVCDDMWRCESRSSGYVQEMRHLCSEQGGGCVVLSTRDDRLSEAVDERSKVRFDVRDEKESGEMLCGYIGISKDVMTGSSGEVKEAYEKVLQSCGGFAVALGIAGKAVARMRRRSSSVGEAIIRYRRDLDQSALLQQGTGQPRFEEEYAGLFAALQTSLKFVDKTECSTNERYGLTVETLHQGLCVLQKRQVAPITMLCCLWGMEEKEVEGVIRLMEEINVCSVHYCIINGKEKMGVGIHDLVHEYCLMQAREKRQAKQWHERVLGGRWT